MSPYNKLFRLGTQKVDYNAVIISLLARIYCGHSNRKWFVVSTLPQAHNGSSIIFLECRCWFRELHLVLNLVWCICSNLLPEL